jgi:hypothetical protein
VAERIVASAALASGALVESRINVNNVLVSFSFVPTLTFSSGGGTSAVGDQTVLFYVDGGSSVQTAMLTDGAFGKPIRRTDRKNERYRLLAGLHGERMPSNSPMRSRSSRYTFAFQFHNE